MSPLADFLPLKKKHGVREIAWRARSWARWVWKERHQRRLRPLAVGATALGNVHEVCKGLLKALGGITLDIPLH